MRQGGGVDLCPVDRCEELVRGADLMCRRHWNRTPKKLRDAVWKAWRAWQGCRGTVEQLREAREAAVDAVEQADRQGVLL